ncbi:MAG: hypothetical protein IT379_37260 [Deltaproteobacteria bacterium]|nr:hypothetical protein [Deltaproteobacteria bacterium]
MVSPKRLQRVVPLPPETIARATDALIRSGLWERADDGFQFHDWADYQPTKAELADDRRAAIERQKKWRARKRSERLAGSTEQIPAINEDCRRVTNASRDALHNGGQSAETVSGDGLDLESEDCRRVSRRVTNGAPTRPVPTRPEENQNRDAVAGGAAADAAGRVRDLERRYPEGLATRARIECARRRVRGTIADGKWEAFLRRIADHPADLVADAMRVFIERHADGSKDENYLFGIIRRAVDDRRGPKSQLALAAAAPPREPPPEPRSVIFQRRLAAEAAAAAAKATEGDTRAS